MPERSSSDPAPIPAECDELAELAETLARVHPVQDRPVPPEPAVRGEGLLRGLESLLLWIDRLVERTLPPSLNPLGQLGAMANACLLVAVVSGVTLLLWYVPSVHQAHGSLEKLRAGSFLGQWVRSLHRYSSDGCVLFVLLHVLRITAQRRFTGSRWLAWTTGLLLLSAVWLIGWTGYWLAWDVRGQHAALGTARFLDRLPVFAEPISSSFLTDAGVPSLLFFVVFFMHMMLPLGLGIGLWMHLMRVNRARFLTGRAMTGWIVGSLAVLSALLPATSGTPARMLENASSFSMDWWFLWPLAFTDRLGGGVLWALFLGVGLVALAAPWWAVKRRRAPEWKAQVEVSRCFGCTHCSLDCPFNAITMVPREDGKPFPTQASVNPDLCVGCGICTGSCDSQAINLPAFNSRAVEKSLNAWIDARLASGASPFVAFCCSDSAVATLRPGADGRCADLPDWKIERVPCAGWVSSILLERLVKRGAAGVLVAGCGGSDPVAREGLLWTEQRLAGTREPSFDPRKADPERVCFVTVNRTDRASLLRVAQALEWRTAPVAERRSFSKVRLAAASAALSILFSGLVFVLSDLPYRTAHRPEPELVVSLHHAGAVMEPRKLSKEELDKRLPHMRAQANFGRERAPVRLRVSVDEKVLFDQVFAPKGLSRDGASVGFVRLPVAPGTRGVRVEIADTADPVIWTRVWTEDVDFENHHARALLFDTKGGFSLH
jgi:ferredoxin/coenzyme F420-reducing hydrogenase delta subunit